MYEQITITDYILLKISASVNMDMKSVWLIQRCSAGCRSSCCSKTQKKRVSVKSGQSEQLVLLKMISGGG